MDTKQIQDFAKESKTLNEFVRKLGYKCYGSSVKKIIVEHNVDVTHLNISHKYIDQFTNEQFADIIEKAKFWKDAMYECGYNSYKGVPHIKKRAEDMGLNTEHILGDEWAKVIYSGIPTYTLEQICVENSSYGGCQQLLKRLKRELGWEHKCSSCESTTWTFKGETHQIPLELEHINGNHFDHRLENLTFLCPNCHAFTPTYKGKNMNRGKKGQIPEAVVEAIAAKQEEKHKEKQAQSPKQSNKCLECQCDIRKGNLRCFECNKEQMKVNYRPPYEQLIQEIKETSYVAVGKKYGVSDNAIRKWVRAYGNEPQRKHKAKNKKCPECDTLISIRSILCRACSIKNQQTKPTDIATTIK
jgi:5-methylcytosine-specific restriction endonuclease McrA